MKILSSPENGSIIFAAIRSVLKDSLNSGCAIKRNSEIVLKISRTATQNVKLDSLVV